MLKLIAKLVIGGLLVVAACGYLSGNVHALIVDRPCTDVDAVFARGSGQELEGGEYSRFRGQLVERLKSPVSTSFYELGTETYGGQKYQAITVGEWWKNGNAAGAAMSAGLGNDYGKSVDSGVGELQSYLTQRGARCPNTKLVLGGYSQGAQVVGQALSGLSSDIQSKINFVALFGDPKLYLPEGEGTYPPACYGAGMSTWRRTVGNCNADSGSLGARKPFLPLSMENKTGLWCNADDFVCGTSLNAINNIGHEQYKDTGGAIDLAVVEVAQRLKLTLPLEKAAAINSSKYIAGMGATGTDTVFLLNYSGWTNERFAQAKDFIRSMAYKLEGQQSRVALVYYDGGIDGSLQNFSSLSEDQGEFQGSIDGLSSVASTTPVKPVLRTIMNTFEFYERNYKWKKGAVKSIIVVSDSDFFNPDDYGRVTFATVAKRALEIDPVNVYPVVPSSLQSSYQGLAEATSGQVILAGNDPEATLEAAVVKITKRPTALLKNLEYSAKVGQEVVFDASDSYLVDGTIVKYEWDFNGDGMFEQITTVPVATYNYPERLQGTMQVRLTGSNGTTANATAVVNINDYLVPSAPLAPVDLVATISSTTNRMSIVDLSWVRNPEDGSSLTSWAISIDGVVIGKLSWDRASIQVTDIPRGKDVELEVRGISSNGTIGEIAGVVVPKLQPEPPPPSKPVTWLTRLFTYIQGTLSKWGIRLP